MKKEKQLYDPLSRCQERREVSIVVGEGHFGNLTAEVVILLEMTLKINSTGKCP